MSVRSQDVSALLNALALKKIGFGEVISFIEDHYRYRPVDFVNGEVHNVAGSNEGSAKVFAFARLHGLDQLDTLSLFAEHYQAVKDSPDGTDHANIRNFMHWGWQAFSMPVNPLTPRQS